ncbi:MAG: LD-carboxypeptidase [Thermoanaerobaculia bacterium]|nr:LD-carboxypeptidase [Thermoanaerobaculia bacterium]
MTARPRRPTLARGATLGVAALSSRPDLDRLQRGMQALEGLGYRVRRAANLEAASDNFAGDDDTRLAAFHELATDDEVDAVFFARGGHGVLRLLERIDWPTIAAHPKPYVGYSDLTPLLLQLLQRCDMVSFHGPFVAGEIGDGLTPTERDSLFGALENRGEARLPCSFPEAARERGAVEGRLVGGCLSLLVSLLGTPYFPDLAGSILFLEDVNEPYHRIDRMLTHLRLSGRLTGVKGMILGHLEAVDGAARGRRSSPQAFAEELEVIAPVAWGLAVGHARPNLTLPVGGMARLDPERSELVLLTG